MESGEIPFREAARLIGLENGLSILDAENLICCAITGGSVIIKNVSGYKFDWFTRPAAVVPQKSTIARSSEGWDGLDLSGKPCIQASVLNSKRGFDGRSHGGQYGLQDDWTYDRKTLARTLERLGVRHVDKLYQERGEDCSGAQDQTRRKPQIEEAERDRKRASEIMQRIVESPGFEPIPFNRMAKRVKEEAARMGLAPISGRAVKDAWSGIDGKYKLPGAPQTPGNRKKGAHSTIF